MEPDIARYIQNLNQTPILNNYSELEPDDNDQNVWNLSTTREIQQSQIDPVLISIDLRQGIFHPEEEQNEEEQEEEYAYEDDYDNEEGEEEEDDEKGEESYDTDPNYEYSYEEHYDGSLKMNQYDTVDAMFIKLANSGNDQNESKLDSAIRVPNDINILRFLNMDDEYLYYEKISTSRYEPKVVRELIITTQSYSKSKSKRKVKNKKRQLHGLCPYCQIAKFYEINSSAYLHHLTINHGIFSNGNVIKDPIVDSISDEFARCPYESCDDTLIKLKRQEPRDKFKAYCRHVKLNHYEGKNS